MNDRALCDECQARQRRDGGSLTKLERERLVHRWRERGHVEHFRRDCRWFPRDGTAFHQRGIDTRTHIESEAGMSQIVALFGGTLGGIFVLWVPVAILSQTAVNVDVALILTALTPIIVALGALYQMYAARKAANDAAEIKAETKELHTLADGQFTREKENRLFEMQLSRVTLSQLMKGDSQPENLAILGNLDKRIANLQAEISARVVTVASLPSEAAAKVP